MFLQCSAVQLLFCLVWHYKMYMLTKVSKEFFLEGRR